MESGLGGEMVLEMAWLPLMEPRGSIRCDDAMLLGARGVGVRELSETRELWPAAVLSLGDSVNHRSRTQTPPLATHGASGVREPGAPASEQPLPLPLALQFHSSLVTAPRAWKEDAGPLALVTRTLSV